MVTKRLLSGSSVLPTSANSQLFHYRFIDFPFFHVVRVMRTTFLFIMFILLVPQSLDCGTFYIISIAGDPETVRTLRSTSSGAQRSGRRPAKTDERRGRSPRLPFLLGRPKAAHTLRSTSSGAQRSGSRPAKTDERRGRSPRLPFLLGRPKAAHTLRSTACGA